MRYAFAFALAALACAQPLAAQAAPRIAHKPVAGRPYSAAVQVGDMYWFAGKVGSTPETQALARGRTAAETRNVMEAFKALFDELGLDFGDVVQATVYLVDIADFADMNQVYGAYFPTDPPARETVAVKDLVGGAMVEISFIAVKR
jgi:2-iminobutanoate/2-iminopropanoate deaminase